MAKAAGSIQFLDFTTTSKNLLKAAAELRVLVVDFWLSSAIAAAAAAAGFLQQFQAEADYGASSRWNESAEYQPKQPKFLRQENQNKEASSSGKRREIQNVKSLNF